MDMDCENKPQQSAKIAPNNANENVVENHDWKGTKCMNNNDVTVSGMEAPLTAPDDPDMAKVDIISFAGLDETKLVESDDPDATEHSSSFGDTVSDSERCSGQSEGEVELQFVGDSDLASFDAFNSLFRMRKKKLTNHWQNFIHSLKWRCKWAELKIKEIESQSLKYERELAACEPRRHSEAQSTLECFALKALPFSTQSQNRKAIKRRKRKRVEDTTDIKSYFAHHNLFSHLENKRTNRDGALMGDDFGATATMDQHADGIDKFGIATDQLLLEFGNGDSSLEQTLWKIEMVHSRVRKLKNQIEMVMSKNAAKFSSYENLSLLAPYDTQTSSAPSPTISAGNVDITSMGGATHAATQHISAYEVDDLVIPESGISIYGEAVHVPDIIESTAGLLSAADVTLHQPQIGDSSEYIFDNVLIHNEAVEEKSHIFVRENNQVTEGQSEREKGEEEIGGEEESTNPSLALTSEHETLTETLLCPEEATTNSCLASDFNFPRNKRKRGERKAGSGGWSMLKSSGEPDSQ